jgi:hypothetical protein
MGIVSWLFDWEIILVEFVAIRFRRDLFPVFVIRVHPSPSIYTLLGAAPFSGEL